MTYVLYFLRTLVLFIHSHVFMKSTHTRSRNAVRTKGFTLIELLIVIGILGILAAIILVAVDPAKRLRQARNARRASEVNALLNAILNYTVDYKGTLPASINTATSTGSVLLLGTGNVDPVSATTTLLAACPESLTGATGTIYLANLAGDTAFVDSYISQLPVDPSGTNGTRTYDQTITGYYVQKTAKGRIQVGSCNPEDEGNGAVPLFVKR